MRWLIVIAGLIVFVVVFSGVRTGVVSDMLGEDAWVVLPPDDADVAIPGRPTAVVVEFATRAEARKISAAYWRHEHKSGATSAAEEATVRPAPLRYSPSSFTVLSLKFDQSDGTYVEVNWKSPDCPSNWLGVEAFSLD